MKISTKGRYALRLMLDLALHNTGEFITIKSISQRQGISDKYLEQIITQLSKSGYVKSTRGSQGGYRLSRDPKDYTVGSILKLIEGSLAPVSCVVEDEKECERYGECATYFVYEKINEAVDNVVEHITLEDLVERHNALMGNDYII
ncbi:MAG: Rrf2 family transcriptional regulator [Clostridiales bacterium]|nr:Rrf2 family transcriptional regulator [Clostridiales bacterium]